MQPELALLVGAIVGSAIGVFAGPSLILPACRKLWAWLKGDRR
jgi:hypothetical protein